MLRRPLITPRTCRYLSNGFLSRNLSIGTSFKRLDPLRILFCGSDHFSCVSLKALHNEHQHNRELIKSIDVLVRPGKPFGKGRRPKVIHEVPIKGLADQLSLNVHERDTFTGWQMPRPDGESINLIVAVSFGLFVPPRLLRETKYGGLNVHPSLLPDFRGPAPLHHVLLQGRTHTGVTVQTLSEHTFDAGAIRAQTTYPPGIPVPEKCTVQELHNILAPLGASMLVDVLRKGLHAPPHQAAGWIPTLEEQAQLVHAPKIQLTDRQLRWVDVETGNGPTAEEVETRARVLGRLWSHALLKDGSTKRVILEDVQAIPTWPPLSRKTGDTLFTIEKEYESGRAVFVQEPNDVTVQVMYWHDGESIIIPTKEGYVKIGNITVDGSKQKPAARVVQSFSEGAADPSSDPDCVSVPILMGLMAGGLQNQRNGAVQNDDDGLPAAYMLTSGFGKNGDAPDSGYASESEDFIGQSHGAGEDEYGRRLAVEDEHDEEDQSEDGDEEYDDEEEEDEDDEEDYDDDDDWDLL